MARRANFDNHKVSHERWLVSYSDFVTLLFAFFVVMYSVSQVSENKYRVLSETLDEVFDTPKHKADKTVVTEQSATDLQLQHEANAKLGSELKALLKENQIEGKLVTGGNEEWIELSLDTELLFKSGSADANPRAFTLFNQLGDIFSGSDSEVQVSGYTDNVPIKNAQFSSNWDLSAARALSVVKLLVAAGMKPERLSAVAFGENHPVADNSSEAGRRKNRRVVLRVSKAPAPESVTESSSINASVDDSTAAASPESTPVAGPSPESTLSPSPAPAPSPSADVVKPVRLQGGDLLFSSDPDLPRSRPREEQ